MEDFRFSVIINRTNGAPLLGKTANLNGDFDEAMVAAVDKYDTSTCTSLIVIGENGAICIYYPTTEWKPVEMQVAVERES